MKLQIRTNDDIVYDLSTEFPSVGISRGSDSVDLDIVQKSFTPGAIFNGERRQESKSISISGSVYEESDELYREKINQLFYYCKNAFYIEDTDNSIRARVECTEFSESPDDETATANASGTFEISFNQLLPFWEDIDPVEESYSGESISINHTNNGYADTPAVFTLESSTPCGSVAIFLTDPVRGIEISDLLFGTDPALDKYVIDCVSGDVRLGDDAILRNDRISGGSGFFDFPVGSFVINFEFSASVNVSFSYRRRYFA